MASLCLWPQPARAQATVDYIILIDTSYSMLFDPGDPERAAAEVAAQSGARLGEDGRIIISAIRPGTLSSGLLSRVKDVAKSLVSSAADGTTVAVYAFNNGVVAERVAEIDPVTRRDLLAFIRGLGASGDGTAIYDSMGEALERVEALRLISKKPREATILLFTDGEENGSTLTFEDILDRYDLLRSEKSHLLFWRYYIPEMPESKDQVERSAPGASSEEMAQTYEILEEKGVEFYNIEKLEGSFAPERVSVEPTRLELGSALANGVQRQTLLLRASPNRKTPLDVWITAEFPSASEEGLLVQVRPAHKELTLTDGQATLELEFSLANAPSHNGPSGRSDGMLRLTSRQILLFEPAGIPISLDLGTGAKDERPAGLSLAAAGLLLAASFAGLLLWWSWLRRRGEAGVLIAAGDEETRMLALRALDGAGLTLLTAHDSDQAWATLKRSRPKLLVLDGDLPESGGKHLIERYRAEPRLRRLPVLWLAGKDEKSRPAETNNGPTLDRLERPLAPNELRRRALDLLRR